MGRRLLPSWPLLGTGYRIGARLTRALPPGPRYALAGAGGSAWYLLSPGQRRNALGNYAAVLGKHPDDPEVARVARRAFANYGRMLADFVLIGGLGPAELVSRMSVTGREHLDAGLAAGKGVIMAAPHMGSWDMGGSFAGSMGYRMSTVATRFPGSLDAAVAETRQALGLRVIPLERAAVKAIGQELAANAVVALLCDLEHGPGVEVEFFGQRAVVPPGAAAFAARTGAAVLPACVWRSGPGRYHVHIEPPLAPPHPGKDGARELMQRVVARFEGFIRPRPDQWYAFRPMFNVA
jgi:lauroyl/myristoyl acyltransferase